MRSLLVVVLLVALFAGASGCGSDEKTISAQNPPPAPQDTGAGKQVGKAGVGRLPGPK